TRHAAPSPGSGQALKAAATVRTTQHIRDHSRIARDVAAGFSRAQRCLFLFRQAMQRPDMPPLRPAQGRL
ncbi:MAG: hypothetical protein ACRD3T_21030, partial [Terriglobia bacterium]